MLWRNIFPLRKNLLSYPSYKFQVKSWDPQYTLLVHHLPVHLRERFFFFSCGDCWTKWGGELDLGLCCCAVNWWVIHSLEGCYHRSLARTLHPMLWYQSMPYHQIWYGNPCLQALGGWNQNLRICLFLLQKSSPALVSSLCWVDWLVAHRSCGVPAQAPVKLDWWMVVAWCYGQCNAPLSLPLEEGFHGCQSWTWGQGQELLPASLIQLSNEPAQSAFWSESNLSGCPT